MRAVRSRDTGPEMIVRRAAWRAGFRYRLHVRRLPGCPDLVFARRRKVILVHGCFWHGHECRRGARVPAQNTAYWTAKIDANRRRDTEQSRTLAALGWQVLTIWECATHNGEALALMIQEFLSVE